MLDFRKITENNYIIYNGDISIGTLIRRKDDNLWNIVIPQIKLAEISQYQNDLRELAQIKWEKEAHK